MSCTSTHPTDGYRCTLGRHRGDCGTLVGGRFVRWPGPRAPIERPVRVAKMTAPTLLGRPSSSWATPSDGTVRKSAAPARAARAAAGSIRAANPGARLAQERRRAGIPPIRAVEELNHELVNVRIIARDADVSYDVLRSYRLGRRNLSPLAAVRIADALRRHADELRRTAEQLTRKVLDVEQHELYPSEP